MEEIRHVLRSVAERISAGKLLDFRLDYVGRGMIETKCAIEAKRLGAGGKALNGDMIAQGIPDAPKIGRRRSNLAL